MWKINSAAIKSWHVGKPPNPHSCDIFKKYNLNYEHLARQITQNDFYEYDFIFGMDRLNIRDLNNLKPIDSHARIFLLGEFDPEGERIIHDPYFVGHLVFIKIAMSKLTGQCKSIWNFL